MQLAMLYQGGGQNSAIESASNLFRRKNKKFCLPKVTMVFMNATTSNNIKLPMKCQCKFDDAVILIPKNHSSVKSINQLFCYFYINFHATFFFFKLKKWHQLSSENWRLNNEQMTGSNWSPLRPPTDVHKWLLSKLNHRQFFKQHWSFQSTRQ